MVLVPLSKALNHSCCERIVALRVRLLVDDAYIFSDFKGGAPVSTPGVGANMPLVVVQISLKKHYRIGKKKNKLRRLQIYIKLTRSNDDESWKHPLKYFWLKCQIWWEINNLTLRLEFIAQLAFYKFLFWHRCNVKFVIGVSLFSRGPDGLSISNFYRFVSLCIWCIT